MASSANDVIIAAGVCAAYLIIKKKKTRNRRWWQKQLLREGVNYGNGLMNDLKLEDGNGFRNFMRMSSTDFENLLLMVSPKITKSDTKFRAAIPPSIRLAITLRFLATGDSYSSLMYLFKVSKQLISSIIPEVCEALTEALAGFVKIPETEAEWKKIEKDFSERWNFPHCLGAMDGKHIVIDAPANSGSTYYNYKGTYSIVLMAIVDADYNIIYADVGCQGRISDGGVFQNTSFFKKMVKDELNIPTPTPLPGRNTAIPYVLVADDAFALGENIMKPFPGHHPKGSPERIFSYRLSRARRIVENVFGLLATVFRLFRRSIPLAPQKVESIVLTCVHLHNFLRRNSRSRSVYSPPGTFDAEDLDTGLIVNGSWRNESNGTSGPFNLRKLPKKSSNSGKEIRNEFAQYFCTELGKVSWQENFA